ARVKPLLLRNRVSESVVKNVLLEIVMPGHLHDRRVDEARVEFSGHRLCEDGEPQLRLIIVESPRQHQNFSRVVLGVPVETKIGKVHERPSLEVHPKFLHTNLLRYSAQNSPYFSKNQTATL